MRTIPPPSHIILSNELKEFPEIELTGATNVNYPCQSPALPDMEAAKALYSTQASLPIPPGLHPAIAAEEDAKRQEARQKLHEIDSYNPESKYRKCPCGLWMEKRSITLIIISSGSIQCHFPRLGMYTDTI